MPDTLISESTQKNIKPVYLRMKDLPRATTLSLSSLYRLRQANLLPLPDARMNRCVLWRPETIETWAQTGGLNCVRGAH
jgi:predicted DNA-binding transcriptional regulator AlpA